MRRISVLNFKGGVGKSTLSMNLAHALARRDIKVLLADLDLQGSTSTLLDEIHEPTLTHVLRGQAELTAAIQQARPNLFILPSDKNLNKAANHIAAEGRHAYNALRKAIDHLQGFDIVLFDHSPNYTAVTESALLASHEMLIPCELSPFSVEGLLTMFEKLEETLDDHSLDIAGIVPFKFDLRVAMHKGYLTDLRESFSDKLLPSIRTDSTISRAQSFHQTVYEYDETHRQHSKAAEDFNRIATMLTNTGEAA